MTTNHGIQMESTARFLNEIIYMYKKAKEENEGNRWDFSRSCILTFPRLIVLILSLVSSGKDGTDTHIRIFFKHARRSGLWDNEIKTVTRKAVSDARKKMPWEVFSNLLRNAVYLALDVWPNDQSYTYKGFSVYAIDGSKYTLPSSKSLRKEFNPKSGLEYPGKGHYPQCLVSTAYDVFRRIPVGRTVMPVNASEREEAQKLIPNIPKGILIFDRGYPSYELLLFLQDQYSGFYLFRCLSSNTFPSLVEFISSDELEQIIWIAPSKKYKEKISPQERKKLKPICVRALKVENDAGEVVILITNLFDEKLHPREEIGELYCVRWEVESYYRDEKVTCEIEQFRSKNPNGIRQELFAATVMSVIARTLMVLSGDVQPYHHNLSNLQKSELSSKSEQKNLELTEDVQKKKNCRASICACNKEFV